MSRDEPVMSRDEPVKPSLLLHVCCGPCAIMPLRLLLEAWRVSGLFFNPNVHPAGEHARRLEGAEAVFGAAGVELVPRGSSMQAAWESFAGGQRERCAMCYETRLTEAASAARAGGHEAFSTTLLVSPYQDHGLIRETGERAGARAGVAFHYEDFRPRFREGQAIAREMGIYRQKYCGCSLSKHSSYSVLGRHMAQAKE